MAVDPREVSTESLSPLTASVEEETNRGMKKVPLDEGEDDDTRWSDASVGREEAWGSSGGCVIPAVVVVVVAVVVLVVVVVGGGRVNVAIAFNSLGEGGDKNKNEGK